MSESRFLTWLATCRDESTRGSGLTAGDLMHCGLRDYVERFPCPNGLPVDRSSPRESAAYRARVERARQSIRDHREQFSIQDLADGITDDQLELFLSIINKGQS